ncbi:MAG: hypothetical protein J07HQW1_00270 [Haloquadratum walsbyi J07HQW1]|uniref:Uncharacterized protein n=1 Tax=Haloquadratum walsbyi J07HQW1 TaxID=1238424 RepID=U1P9M9_9EURY|nr:MAG: hypothetical protein J07HQW1_00270 [Haloquadratum walsbyi J07HQW1]
MNQVVRDLFRLVVRDLDHVLDVLDGNDGPVLTR